MDPPSAHAAAATPSTTISLFALTNADPALRLAGLALPTANIRTAPARLASALVHLIALSQTRGPIQSTRICMIIIIIMIMGMGMVECDVVSRSVKHHAGDGAVGHRRVSRLHRRAAWAEARATRGSSGRCTSDLVTQTATTAVAATAATAATVYSRKAYR